MQGIGEGGWGSQFNPESLWKTDVREVQEK